VDISAIQSSRTTHRTHTYLRDPQSPPPAPTCPANDKRIPPSSVRGARAKNPRPGQSVDTYHRPPRCGSNDSTVLRPPSSAPRRPSHRLSAIAAAPELPFMCSPSGSVLEAVRGRAPGTPAVAESISEQQSIASRRHVLSSADRPRPREVRAVSSHRRGCLSLSLRVGVCGRERERGRERRFRRSSRTHR